MTRKLVAVAVAAFASGVVCGTIWEATTAERRAYESLVLYDRAENRCWFVHVEGSQVSGQPMDCPANVR